MKRVRIKTSVSFNNKKPLDEFEFDDEIVDELVAGVKNGDSASKMKALELLIYSGGLDVNVIELDRADWVL